MARAPPDLDPRVRFLGPEGGDVPPGLEGGTLGVESFLAPAHVGLVALPGHALLPRGRIAGRSIFQAGPVCEDSQARPV